MTKEIFAVLTIIAGIALVATLLTLAQFLGTLAILVGLYIVIPEKIAK